MQNVRPESAGAASAPIAPEDRFAALVLATAQIVWSAGPRGAVAERSPSWTAFTGHSDTREWGWMDAIHPDDREGARATWLEVMEKGEPAEWQYRLRRADGVFAWVSVRAAPVRDADGRVQEWVGCIRDITEERQARARVELLARASRELAASLDWEETLTRIARLSMPTLGDFGFFDVIEADGSVRRIAWAHEDPRRLAMLERTRWERSDRRDLNLCALSTGRSVLHADIDRDWMENAAGSPERAAMMCDLGFGSMISVPLPYEDRVVGALTLFRAEAGRHTQADLEAAEELARYAAVAVENARLYRESREALRHRDDFLSIASHELRTPMVTLKLYTDTLLAMLADATPQDLPRILGKVEAFKRDVVRVDGLIGRLLDMTRISNGRLDLEAEELDLGALAAEVAERFRDELSERSCLLELRVEEVRGTWDRLRLEQVLTNLLTNAMKYGAGRPIDVEVRRDGARAVLTVRDRGIGIPEADQERIFERFERAVERRRYGGLGLGLWICRSAVEVHGGRIRVESRPGEGATFVVELPIAGS